MWRNWRASKKGLELLWIQRFSLVVHLVCIWIFKIWYKVRRKYWNKGEVRNTFKDACSLRGQHVSWRGLTLRRNSFLVSVFLPVTKWAFENRGQNTKYETAWSYKCHLTWGEPFEQITCLNRIKRENLRPPKNQSQGNVRLFACFFPWYINISWELRSVLQTKVVMKPPWAPCKSSIQKGLIVIKILSKKNHTA